MKPWNIIAWILIVGLATGIVVGMVTCLVVGEATSDVADIIRNSATSSRSDDPPSDRR